MRISHAALQAVILGILPGINAADLEERQQDDFVGLQDCNYFVRQPAPAKTHCGVQGDVPRAKPLDTFSTPSMEICRNACLNDSKCVSFQFSPDSDTCVRYPHSLRGTKYKVNTNGKYGYNRACFTKSCSETFYTYIGHCGDCQQQQRRGTLTESELSRRDQCNPCQMQKREDGSSVLMWKREECPCQQQQKRVRGLMAPRQEEECQQQTKRSEHHLWPRDQCCQQQQQFLSRDLLQPRTDYFRYPGILVARGTYSSLDGRPLNTQLDGSTGNYRLVTAEPGDAATFEETQYEAPSDWTVQGGYSNYYTYVATYDYQSLSESTGQPVIFQERGSLKPDTPRLSCGLNANPGGGAMGCNTGDGDEQVVFYTCNPEDGELLFGSSVPAHCLPVTITNIYGCQQQR